MKTLICWLFHEWSDWNLVIDNDLVSENTPLKYKRECRCCGMVETREVGV